MTRSEWRPCKARAMPRRLRAYFNGRAKLDQSDQGYNDRAEQAMIDVRYWHKADSLRGLAASLLLEVKQALPAHLEMPLPSRPSAFGCRADTTISGAEQTQNGAHEESPLMTQSGHL